MGDGYTDKGRVRKMGTLKIFVAYLISKAIEFSRYVASFGAYIISQATGFLRYAASFEAYLRSKAAGFFVPVQALSR